MSLECESVRPGLHESTVHESFLPVIKARLKHRPEGWILNSADAIECTAAAVRQRLGVGRIEGLL
jgi:hypothetical protein